MTKMAETGCERFAIEANHIVPDCVAIDRWDVPEWFAVAQSACLKVFDVGFQAAF